MHIENLASVLTEVKSEEMQSRLDERLLAFTTGEIDHASEAFLSLWKSLVRRESNVTIRDTRSNAVSPSRFRKRFALTYVQQPGHPPSAGSQPLNKALIKSIRQGLFCDRRYSAKLDDTGKWRAPVYVSSIVLGDAVRGLNFRKSLSTSKISHLIQAPQSNRGSEGQWNKGLRRWLRFGQ